MEREQKGAQKIESSAIQHEKLARNAKRQQEVLPWFLLDCKTTAKRLPFLLFLLKAGLNVHTRRHDFQRTAFGMKKCAL